MTRRQQTPRAEDFELPRRSGQHRALLREERHQHRACKEHQWRATLLGAGSHLRVRQVLFEIESQSLGARRSGAGLDTPLPHCQPRSTLHPRRSTEAFFVQSFPRTLAHWYRGGLRVNIAQLWNMSKKTIIALAVLDTHQKKDPFGSSEFVSSSLFFARILKLFFSRKRTRSVRVKTSLPPFNPSAGCRVSACQELGQEAWTNFITCFPLAKPLGQGTWTTAGCLVTQPRTHGNTAARGCPSSLSKFPGRTWTSGSARGKHVIEFVQVPCPSSCPSSGLGGGSEKIARPHTRSQGRKTCKINANQAKSCKIMPYKNRAKTG